MKIFKYSIVLLTVIFIYKLTFAQREPDGKMVSHWSSYSSPIAVTEAGNGSIIVVQNEDYGSGKDIFVQLVDSADYNSNFTHESLKKKQLITNNNLLSSRRLSRIYCQTLFETTKENGLNAIAKPGDKKYKKKNPAVAFGLAFIPGFFVHGLGHLYVEKHKTFVILLSVEVISTSLILYHSFRNYNKRETGDYHVMTLLLLISTWLGSWVYDIIGATQIANDIQEYKKCSISTQSFLIDNELANYIIFSFNF